MEPDRNVEDISFETIVYAKRGNVAWITLNRPEVLNAMNLKMAAELINALQLAADDEETYVIAITGTGDKAFCAGADIGAMTNRSPVDQVNSRYVQISHFAFMRKVPKPIVALVNGLAIGGGCELALASDIVIAAENAQFSQPEIRVGLIPGGGATQILPRLIGEKRAKEIIFTGRPITAQEALEMGMINQVVPQEKLIEAANNFIGVLTRRSPIILKFAKLAINRSLETTLSAGIDAERDFFTLCFSTEDQKEGAKAFHEKRSPRFKGK